VSQDRSCVDDPLADDQVSLIVASHSRAIARGVAELVAQVAPGVRIVPVGGALDGTLGTDVAEVLHALRSVAGRRGAVVLMDIGSSVLTVLAAIAMLEEGDRAQVLMADAPLVEGAIAAGVEAAAGSGATDVLRAAERARRLAKL
jgi:PTS hybrid protein